MYYFFTVTLVNSTFSHTIFFQKVSRQKKEREKMDREEQEKKREREEMQAKLCELKTQENASDILQKFAEYASLDSKRDEVKYHVIVLVQFI